LNRSKSSTFVTIPKALVKELGWGRGEKLAVELKDGVVIVYRAEKWGENVRKLRRSGYSYVLTIPPKIARKLKSKWLVVERRGNVLKMVEESTNG